MKPLLLKPIPDYTIWGSDHLSKHRNYDRKYGTGWEVSAHPYCTNKITNLLCLPDSIKNETFYHPTNSGHEKQYAEILKRIENIKKNMNS